MINNNKDLETAYNPNDWKLDELIEGTERFIMAVQGWPALDLRQAEARQRSLEETATLRNGSN
jgi:hypothetical protein